MSGKSNSNKEVNEGEGENINLPNNDFCFTSEDVIEQRDNINSIMRHEGIYQRPLIEIKELNGHEVIVKSGDGEIV